jgi:murein DD-endopeptidase MepM/ murein hydrolase activator NlpD
LQSLASNTARLEVEIMAKTIFSKAILIALVAFVIPVSKAAAERPLWPLRGVMTQKFSYAGPKRGHSGLDLAAPVGTCVYAALSGTVSKAGWDRTGYGYLVLINGIDGRLYYYAHNSRILVRVGQSVRQGQAISKVGNTGRSTGPHLHFEIRASRSSYLNPLAFLPRSMVRQAGSRGC